MSPRFSPDTAYRIGRWLHLFTAIIFISMAIGTDIWAEYTSNSASRKILNYWHVSVGMTFILLLFLRMSWVLAYPERRSRFDSRWQAVIARLNQYGLYTLMIVVPLSGLISLLANGDRLMLFDLFSMQADEWLFYDDLAFYAEEIHLWLKWPIYVLLSLHVAGAMSHWLLSRRESSS